MNWEYKTVRVFEKTFWRQEINVEKLDGLINEYSRLKWELHGINITSFLGMEKSAVCIFKRKDNENDQI